MRIIPRILGLVLAIGGVAAAEGADALDERFGAVVAPFLKDHCLACHGEVKPGGDLNLARFGGPEAVVGELDQWEAVAEQVEAGTMPPAKAKSRPSTERRVEFVAWIRDVRKREADRQADDPGPVPAHRLSNAEYDNTIRDLTGVDLRPTRAFPVDPANAAGFDNTGESLAMSPALVKKYLEAARAVADHLVLKPDGFAFAADPAVADTDRDKYCVRRIIDFYKGQSVDLAAYFLAARRVEREGGGPVDRVAAEAGLSPKYLATVRDLLRDSTDEVGPIAALRALWLSLPDDPTGARAGAERMRDFALSVRKQVTPEVKNLTSRGIQSGSQTLVLWKNRQFVANRRRYAGGALKVEASGIGIGSPAAKAMAVPDDPEGAQRFEATFERFCSTFPDTFFVSERARVYMDPNGEKDNAGRLLSAGFHSMTGYFRDDAPLADLMLDDAGRLELDRLWEEFDFITAAPLRQYASFLWFERTDSTYMRGQEFDFARAEDKDAASEARIAQLAEVYAAKAKRLGAGEKVLGAIRDYFEGINAAIRRVERGRLAAEPVQVRALVDFAGRAYRRPLTSAEREAIPAFYRTLREADGLGHEDAVRDSVVGILLSPHFCYRGARPEAGAGVRPLADIELAERLGYFLWASMPDQTLMDLAASGRLHDPEILKGQARRMLQDPRARALGTEFLGNWLDFRRFEEHNSVDRRRFPSFDDGLRRAMFEEPIRFFGDVVRADRSILGLLDADHSIVNPALARHYGMPEPAGGPDDWSQVEGARGYGRGGLTSMAVFLTRNSPGLRTSPVKRGFWVARRLLGENIPAPPAVVPDLPDDESKSERTLRESLERHRADNACAGCHKRFDPIGLAFEGYGPIGERRTLDLGGHPVDPRADFPGGFEGSGIEGLRAYLDGHRRADFVDTFCRKLLSYALGRTLRPSDDPLIGRMHARLDAEGHRFGPLVEAIVTSPAFLNRRGDGPSLAGATDR